MRSISTIYLSKLIFSLIIFCASPKPYPNRQPPKILLKGYLEDEAFEYTLASSKFPNLEADYFENEFVIKNLSDYTMTWDTTRILFACEANYPIQWKILYPNQFSGLDQSQILLKATVNSEFKEGDTQPRILKYATYLSLANSFSANRYQTGYLSCEYVDEPKIETRIYLWSQGNRESSSAMEFITDKITVFSDPPSLNLIIPCRPIYPDTSLALEQELDTSHLNNWRNRPNKTYEWVSRQLSPFVNFDAKVGFTLNKDILSKARGNGSYRCYETDDEGDGMNRTYKYVDVIAGTEPVIKFAPIKEIKPPANFFELGENLHCCTGNGKGPPKVTIFGCKNAPECEFFQELFIRDGLTGHLQGPNYTVAKCDCAITTISFFRATKLAFLYKCEGENINVVTSYYFATMGAVTAFTPVANGVYSYGMKHYDSFTNISTEQKSTFIFQRAHILKGKRLQLAKRNHHDLYRSIERLKLIEKITPEGYEALRERYVKNGAWYLSSALEKEEWMFDGMRVIFYCMPYQYFYADGGGWLAITWKNGSRTIFEDMNLYEWYMHSESGFRFFRISMGIGLSAIIGLFTLDVNMKSVDCFLPVWNSQEWEKKSYQFRIKELIKPQFENGAEESVNINLNESNVTINCSVMASEQNVALPVAFKWEKDGKGLVENKFMKIIASQRVPGQISTSSYSAVIFQNVSHETHGKYKCIGDNGVVAVEKVYRVYVTDERVAKRTQTMVIAAIVSTIIIINLIVILVLLIWRRWKSRSIKAIPRYRLY